MFKFWKKNTDNIDSEQNKNQHEDIDTNNNIDTTEDIDINKEKDNIDKKYKENDSNETYTEIDTHDVDNQEYKRTKESYLDENIIESSNLNEGSEKPISKNKGIFARLFEGLAKTKDNITGRIDSILKSYTKIDEELLEELEEVLITADVGLNTTMDIIDNLRSMIKERGVKEPLQVRYLLKEIIENMLSEGETKIIVDPSPAIIVMVGVNGVGKTTTIGKLAQKYKSDGKKVILAAADTFRAAASEQLDIWAKRVGVDIVKHHEGADPGAVVFDAIKAAQARKSDILICDTAGRLHNKANLMNELGKIFKIIDKEFPEAKKEVLLVVDATTGQNAVSQAKTFKEVANITGIVLTKLDGTAKGGVVLAVKSEVDVPVKLIGVGERVEDLQKFDSKSFTNALFGDSE